MPFGGKARIRAKAVNASETAKPGEHRRRFRLESRAGEFRVVASSSGVSRRGTGKPNVHSRDALPRVLTRGPCPLVPHGRCPVRNNVVPLREPRTENAKPIDLGRSRWKPEETPVDDRSSADVQLACVTLVKG